LTSIINYVLVLFMSFTSADGFDPRLAALTGGPGLPRAFQLGDDEGDEDDWLEEQRGMLRALARLGMEMALDIGAEARALEQRRALGAGRDPEPSPGEAGGAIDEDDDDDDEAEDGAPTRGWTELALAFSRVSRAIRQCIETDVKICAYQAAKDAADRQGAAGPGARAGAVAEQPHWVTPEERKARDDRLVNQMQDALSRAAEIHVYRAVRMVEGEDPDVSVLPGHDVSITWRTATGAILKACRDLALARYLAHPDAAWGFDETDFEEGAGEDGEVPAESRPP
jgi:hypothetical protein